MVAESYRRMAYKEADMAATVRDHGFDSFELCIAHLTSRGLTLAQIAQELGLDQQRFTAYHAVWLEGYAPPLMIWENDDTTKHESPETRVGT